MCIRDSGYSDLAVIQGEDHSYLALTAPASQLPIITWGKKVSTNNGNVFILDINALKISKSGSGMAVLSTKETLTPLVSVQDIPVNQGQEPQFISAAGIWTNADGVQQLRLCLLYTSRCV